MSTGKRRPPLRVGDYVSFELYGATRGTGQIAGKAMYGNGWNVENFEWEDGIERMYRFLCFHRSRLTKIDPPADPSKDWFK